MDVQAGLLLLPGVGTAMISKSRIQTLPFWTTTTRNGTLALSFWLIALSVTLDCSLLMKTLNIIYSLLHFATSTYVYDVLSAQLSALLYSVRRALLTCVQCYRVLSSC